MSQINSSSSLPTRAPHPRTIFQSVADALQATPFFIDEEGIGPWLSTSDKNLLARGKIAMSTRDAVHIPSLEKNGDQIRTEVINMLCRQAESIGLTEIGVATGYWTLTETGKLQSEPVLITYSNCGLAPGKLRLLASEIARVANQDAIAIEISGKVEHWRG